MSIQKEIFVITFIFLIAASFLLLYVTLFNKKKRKHAEETQTLLMEFERELVKTQMEVQEQTIKTIASDIHDNVGQLLSLTRMTLSSIDHTEIPDKASQKLSNSLSLLSTSIKELRQLAAILHAENVLAEGLEVAIKAELAWLSKSERHLINFNRTGEPKVIDAKYELIAYRILQEVLNNIVKHAEATAIHLDMQFAEKSLILRITDNGKGFALETTIQKPVGLGINNLYKRAAIIEGSMDIQSDPINGGTTVTLTIPLKPGA